MPSFESPTTRPPIVVLGPRGAGKTYLLKGLFRAAILQASQDLHNSGNLSLFSHNLTFPTRVFEDEKTMLKSGNFELIPDEVESKWGLVIKNPSNGWPQHYTPAPLQEVVCLDRAEADIFPIQGSGYIGSRATELLKRAAGIVYCVDPSLPNISDFYRVHLERMLLLGVPIQRVVFALTKADLFLSRYARRLNSLANEPAEDKISRMFGRVAMAKLRAFCSHERISAFWTSVHGFLADGSPNLDPDHSRLRTRIDAGFSFIEANDSWCPFQVLNPFLSILMPAAGRFREF